MSRTTATGKKRAKRADIALEPIKKLLKTGASSTLDTNGNKKIRVSRDTMEAVRVATALLVADLANECRSHLLFSKRKTATAKTFNHVILHSMQKRGLDLSLIQATAICKTRSRLSRAGLIRMFKQTIGQKQFRISGSGKTVLVAVVESYITTLGKASGRYASAAHRSTIKPSDISSALKSMLD